LPGASLLNASYLIEKGVSAHNMSILPLSPNHTAIAKREKTHCIHGHPLSDCFRFRKDGTRRCRTCNRNSKRMQYQRAHGLLPFEDV
jgi:hypothetical protein